MTLPPTSTLLDQLLAVDERALPAEDALSLFDLAGLVAPRDDRAYTIALELLARHVLTGRLAAVDDPRYVTGVTPAGEPWSRERVVIGATRVARTAFGRWADDVGLKLGADSPAARWAHKE